MVHPVSFLAISPSYEHCLLNRVHVVMRSGADTMDFDFDGLLAVCLSCPGVHMSAYAHLKYLLFTPTHKSKCFN